MRAQRLASPARAGWIVLALVGFACGGAGTGATTATTDDPGGRLYAINCSACHGANGEGSATGPALSDERYHVDVFPDAGFVAAVESGVHEPRPGYGPMPAIPGLSHSEIASITRYVRSLQTG